MIDVYKLFMFSINSIGYNRKENTVLLDHL